MYEDQPKLPLLRTQVPIGRIKDCVRLWNAWCMGTALFITIAVMTVIIAITAGLFARGRNLRVLTAGIGFALIPLALQLTGLSTLLVNGVNSLIAWTQRTGWNDTMAWGAGLGGAGIFLIVLSGFLPRSERTSPAREPKTRAVASEPRRPAVGSPNPGAAAAKPAPAASQPARKAAVDEDIDEIEAILKKRGIV